jgi:hypothetical protein
VIDIAAFAIDQRVNQIVDVHRSFHSTSPSSRQVITK